MNNKAYMPKKLKIRSFGGKAGIWFLVKYFSVSISTFVLTEE